jgi:hypothetical protein
MFVGLYAPVALAASEPTPADIRAAADAFDKGREAYEAEDHVGAAEHFERADTRASSATALEYAIRARDKAGQLDRAATLAALASQRYPNEQNLLTLATEVLERARTELYELSVQCDEACEIAVGGKIIHGGFSTERIIFLPEGTHTIRAGFSNDRSDSEEVQATAGGHGQATLEAPAEEVDTPPEPTKTEPEIDEPPPPPAESSEGLPPTVFWVGLGLTAAVGGVTVWSGIDTVNNPGEEAVRKNCEQGDTDCPLYQDGLKSQLRTNILIGVTSALGVGTVIIGAFATDWGGSAPESEESGARGGKRKSAWIEPWVSIGEGAAVGARGRF